MSARPTTSDNARRERGLGEGRVDVPVVEERHRGELTGDPVGVLDDGRLGGEVEAEELEIPELDDNLHGHTGAVVDDDAAVGAGAAGG